MNSVNSVWKEDEGMVGMLSILSGQTNQFIGDGSFWSRDVSERFASYGAWTHASYGP